MCGSRSVLRVVEPSSWPLGVTEPHHLAWGGSATLRAADMRVAKLPPWPQGQK